MASSYFDLQPRSRTTAEDLVGSTEDGKKEELVRPRYLTPQVSSILDSWEHFSSDDSDSDDEVDSGVDSKKGDKAAKPSTTDKNPIVKNLEAQKTVVHCEPGTPVESKGKEKAPSSHLRLARHPRLERFVSLRSTLFSTHIEENLKNQAPQQDTPTTQTEDNEPLSNMADSAEHPRRQSLAHRMSSTLRKITSRDVPTLRHIKEEPHKKAKPEDSPSRQRKDSAHVHSEHDSEGEESMHDEDVDDLVRWVSRRKSSTHPGEGALQQANQSSDTSKAPLVQQPATHASLAKSRLAEQSPAPSEPPSEGLAPTDVNDIVSWVRSKHTPEDQEPKKGSRLQPVPPGLELPTRPSVISTTSENYLCDYSDEEEDNSQADELELASKRSMDPNEHAFDIPADQITLQDRRPTAFVSPKGSHHTEGPAATPLSRQSIPEGDEGEEDSVQQTSSTDFAAGALGDSSTSHGLAPPPNTLGKQDSHTSHTSRKSQDTLATQEDRISDMNEEEVVGLIRTVTQDETSPDEEVKREAAILKWRVEKERQQREGHVDEHHKGDLSEEDVDELVKWVSRRASAGGFKGTMKELEEGGSR